MNSKEKFLLELKRKVSRPGIENLITFLESSDFFTAPASLKLHHTWSGGLCDYAWDRYDYMLKLVKDTPRQVEEESIAICALLANLDKINYFEPTVFNRKHYCADGDRKDDVGTFKWVAERGYAVRDPADRFIFGTSGQNAERIITNYIPLKDEESAAIINLGVSYENPTFNYSHIYKKYKLACILSAADQLATYLSAEEDIPF